MARGVFIVVQVSLGAFAVRPGIQRVYEHRGNVRRPGNLYAGIPQL